MSGIDRNEEPHRHREWAESFGTDPERYHRTRPRYPAELIRDLVDLGAAIDAYGGAFLVQYTTVLVTAERRPSS